MAALAILSVLAPGIASAQYPTKAIKLVVPYPPGGPVDNIGRIIAQPLPKGLGQPVVLENRAGAAGTIARARGGRAP